LRHDFNLRFRVVETTTFEVRTGAREGVVDITGQAAEFARTSGGDGLLHVFVPHATAGIGVLETGSGSETDLLNALRDLLPPDDRWRHAHGSRGHGRSHVMPALIAPYCTVPVLDGELALGTWQSICLVDLNADNPVRTVRLSLLRG
jgi:secondary thiamine-phosphate synthase enzyme